MKDYDELIIVYNIMKENIGIGNMRRILLNHKIDFAFKKIFGSEEHLEILI